MNLNKSIWKRNELWIFRGYIGVNNMHVYNLGLVVNLWLWYMGYEMDILVHTAVLRIWQHCTVEHWVTLSNALNYSGNTQVWQWITRILHDASTY